MSRQIYRYSFNACAPMDEVGQALLLAIVSVESLYGESQARLDIQHTLDLDKRACVIDASTRVGRDLNRVFTGLLHREFDQDAFRVKRLEASPGKVGAAASRGVSDV